MEIVKTLEIDNSYIDYAEYLNYNINAYKEIISDILMKKKDDGACLYSNENYRFFMGEYKNINYKYRALCSDIIKTLAPEFDGSDSHEIIFDFEKKVANIILKGSVSCHGCN